MPEVATTASESAPLTRIRLRPRYMSSANRRASKGKRAASAARSNMPSKRFTLRGSSFRFGGEREGLIKRAFAHRVSPRLEQRARQSVMRCFCHAALTL
eukprot:4953192-Amphidinium_carterae.2